MEGGPNIQETDYSISDSRVNLIDDVEESSCTATCLNPSGKFHRFIALFFMCFLGFGELIFLLYIFSI